MWDKRYSEQSYAYGKEPNGFLVAVAKEIPQGNVLCIGEGEGRNAVYLAGLGYQVTALDSSGVGLEKARKLAYEKNVTIRTELADLSVYNIKSRHWQGIVSIFVHFPADIRRRIHRNCIAGLKPGGTFILEGFTPKQPSYGTGGPKVPDLLVTLNDLRQDLEGLDLDIAREIEREIYEGRYHAGLSAVVQILGRKNRNS